MPAATPMPAPAPRWYVVSYDLHGDLSVDAYERIHAALRTAMDYCSPLMSFWIIQTPLSPRQVIQRLLDLSAIDDDDGIVVLEITGIGDFRRLEHVGPVNWLRSHLSRC